MNHGVIYSWDKIKKMRNYKGNPDIAINRFRFQGRTHLTDRLKAERCENCGRTTQFQIHHIGTIRGANRQRIMNKSTKVLCKECHRKITNQQIHDIRKNKNNKKLPNKNAINLSIIIFLLVIKLVKMIFFWINYILIFKN
ncbi:hypothetical protein OC698_01600 ['Gossypium sp.' phytoplasma]|uniref:HNH domain-containing protein n=1 Tax=Candidatus Phytoplasma gossypii TaxID=2982629 RepID=A0ABT9D116_9MOLU|nr:hypothetical protein ['Gossypium sp.' phytoplasma]